MNELQKKWNMVLELIKPELASIKFNTWFAPITVFSFENNVLTLIIPAEFYRDKLMNFNILLKSAIKEVFNSDVTFLLYTNEEISEKKITPIIEPEKEAIKGLNNTGLMKKYRFDNFITGPSNQLAFAAAVSVAENPGKEHNPLFIYGGSGLGKTHLMHSIGNYILEENSDSKILYVSCEQFVNELITSIQTSKTDEFREKYRNNIDVFLIDDIQFLINKESSQNEFFYTFNDLVGMEKQIVITSDRPPEEFTKDLPERLTTRFSCGLLVDITPPEFETRAAIINKKAESANIIFPPDVSAFIANSIKSNIRVLEGALNKVLAYTKLTKEPITLDIAENALKEFITDNSQFQLTSDIIKSAVAEHFNTTVADIDGKSRKKVTAAARQIAMFLCRELLNDTYEKIGETFQRDYSTVIHATRNIEKMMNEGIYSKDIEDIKNKFSK